MYRVLIAEDEERIRTGLAKLIGADPDFQVCALAENGKTALHLAREEGPDLLLVDINMPFLNGLTFIEELGEAAKNAVILIVTGYDNFEYAQKALRLGVFDYLLKPIEDDTFFSALGRAKAYLENRRRKSEYLEWARQEMDRNRRMLTDLFLRRWLNNEYLFSEAEEYLRFSDIEIPLPYLITVIHITGNENAEYHEQGWNETLLYFAAEGIVLEFFSPWGTTLSCRTDRGDMAVISSVPGGNNLDDLIRDIHRNLPDQLPLKVDLEYGQGESPDALPSVYGEVLERLTEKASLPPVVSRAKQYIEQHCHDPLFSLQGAAEDLHISPQHLSRIFRHETGMTLMDYLSRARIRRAGALLLSTDMKMYEIAERVGYTSQHYFSSAFKRVLGISPAEYRKANGRREDP